ncbi:MAG: AI-2E family transporter [Rhizobiaceae bacterium]|nr:AI-2E family transporter [Rhizobiaceae bacterium]
MKYASLELRPVRLRHRSNFESVLAVSAQVAQLVLAAIAVVVALDYGEVILAPIFLGICIGLMFSPLASHIERHGMPTWLSALVIVLTFLILILLIGMGLSVPLAAWIDRAPAIWESLRLQVADWKSLLDSVQGLQKQLSDAMGQASALTVKVDDASAVQSVVSLGPMIVAELLIFLASVYFFVATRDRFRVAVLSMCFTRRMRWRFAHFFRDVEVLISRYLATITVINIGLGIAVTLALWAVGMPSPLLWGVLAILLNFVIYIGPALMTLILLSVSLALHHNMFNVLLAPGIYLALHAVESNFITHQILGARMTMNPFAVFLALAFWIWLWGPIGGFIAVPSLLVLYALARNIIPIKA